MPLLPPINPFPRPVPLRAPAPLPATACRHPSSSSSTRQLCSKAAAARLALATQWRCRLLRAASIPPLPCPALRRIWFAAAALALALALAAGGEQVVGCCLQVGGCTCRQAQQWRRRRRAALAAAWKGSAGACLPHGSRQQGSAFARRLLETSHLARPNCSPTPLPSPLTLQLLLVSLPLLLCCKEGRGVKRGEVQPVCWLACLATPLHAVL